jgi:uncharacterized OsmC-like protein
MNILLDGTTADVTKIMASDPRRISKIVVHIHFPKTLQIEDKEKVILENTARNCPVERTLHPDCEREFSFNW